MTRNAPTAAATNPDLAELIRLAREIADEAAWAERTYPAAGFPTGAQVMERFRELVRFRGLNEALRLARGCYAKLVYPCTLELPPLDPGEGA